MGDFRMPSLGADMEAGTIVEWRVAPGTAVHRGDIVAVVDTEKSTIEVEVFEDGVVDELVVGPGVEVPVGTVLARIATAGAPAAASAPAPAPTAPAPAEPAEAEAEVEAEVEVAQPSPGAPAAPPDVRVVAPLPPARPVPAPVGAAAFVRASPMARRQAAARAVDLAAVAGSGPGGAVVAADVRRAVAPTAPGAAGPQVVPAPPEAARAAAEPAGVGGPPTPAGRDGRDRHAALRRAIGALMARSKREIPHYYLATTVDLEAATTWLGEHNSHRAVAERLLPAALLLKATALAARDAPAMNGFWDGGFRPSAAVHLGVAVSLRGGGLVAPAIHDADRLDLDTLMAALRDLVQRARAGVLRSSEMADPTLTVTNLGDQGVEEVFGVIYPPQVALVGFGRITERPWATGGLLGVRPVVRATLAADHRASDGHDGARFLAALDRHLQTPEDL